MPEATPTPFLFKLSPDLNDVTLCLTRCASWLLSQRPAARISDLQHLHAVDTGETERHIIQIRRQLEEEGRRYA